MRIGGCAFVYACEMIADGVSTIVSSGSSIEKSSLPLVVCFTWRPIEGYEVVLHVDCGMRRRRHRSQVVPGGRTTLNQLRDKKLRVGLHHGRVTSARQLHSVYGTQQTRHSRTRYLHTVDNTHISESASTYSILIPGGLGWWRFLFLRTSGGPASCGRITVPLGSSAIATCCSASVIRVPSRTVRLRAIVLLWLHAAHDTWPARGGRCSVLHVYCVAFRRLDDGRRLQ